MGQLEGYIKQGQEHLVCKLKKALYGLKQPLELGMPNWINIYQKMAFTSAIQILTYM